MKLSSESGVFISHFEKTTRPREFSEKDWESIGAYIAKEESTWDSTKKIKRFAPDLPFSLLVVKEEEPHLFIFPKQHTVRHFAKGGQRTIKRAFDLTASAFVVYKPFSSAEKKISLKCKGHTGVIQSIGFYQYNGKRRMFEPQYEGTLKQLKDTPSADVLQSIFRQLLLGLQRIHHIESKGRRCFHGDIKESNIFFKMHDGSFDVVLADLGVSNSFGRSAGTHVYFAPEYHSLCLKRKYRLISRSVFQDEQVKLVLKNDCWAIGMVFSSILTGGKKSVLTFYPDISMATTYEMELGTKIKQKQIDKLFKKYVRKNKDQALLWEVAKGLLQVDPDKRWDVRRALHILS